ncbi:hypothetical protein PUR57_03715 [Streptomyces sp. JV176]|uniref:hypothetical protein n=1 Tax=Streptomyces sp. JV176 TaxID=858630 RepID=UPI002E7A1577|nr:hypothetical protein [Streptomyces sp. JV176]MEE1797791.1 hypothetical protein [Streptomyces sp. JV176]
MLAGSHADARIGGADSGPADPAALEMMNTLTRSLDPALVSPVVAFPAHEDCPVSGEVCTAGAGQVAWFFVGRTRGYRPPPPALTAEGVRDHLDRIRDETDSFIPADPGAGTAPLRSAARQP